MIWEQNVPGESWDTSKVSVEATARQIPLVSAELPLCIKWDESVLQAESTHCDEAMG